MLRCGVKDFCILNQKPVLKIFIDFFFYVKEKHAHCRELGKHEKAQRQNDKDNMKRPKDDPGLVTGVYFDPFHFSLLGPSVCLSFCVSLSLSSTLSLSLGIVSLYNCVSCLSLN